MSRFENNQTKSKDSSGRGGARSGAGRKKGAATKRTREIADKAVESGETPLEVMLRIMREPTAHEDPKVQIAREAMVFEAAKAAAPYMHPRLATMTVAGDPERPLAFERIVREIVKP